MNIQHFDQRLRETVSWCATQNIVANPAEDDAIIRRRELSRQGADLVAKSYGMLAPYEHAGKITRWLARKTIRRAIAIRRDGEKLMATADASSIVPPLRRQLRSEALRPLASSLAQLGAHHTAIVEKVAEARSQILQKSGEHSVSPSLESRGGRLLLFAPEENLACGAAEYGSLGYFDVNNVPPWDTWITMLEGYLVSWVPPQLIPLVQEGLDVNPEQCILWADDPLLSKKQIAATLGRLSTKVV